jgi:hypothetical protein
MKTIASANRATSGAIWILNDRTPGGHDSFGAGAIARQA